MCFLIYIGKVCYLIRFCCYFRFGLNERMFLGEKKYSLVLVVRKILGLKLLVIVSFSFSLLVFWFV